eukprot:2511020-Pyramimonas_sp.AAC.1
MSKYSAMGHGLWGAPPRRDSKRILRWLGWGESGALGPRSHRPQRHGSRAAPRASPAGEILTIASK